MIVDLMNKMTFPVAVLKTDSELVMIFPPIPFQWDIIFFVLLMSPFFNCKLSKQTALKWSPQIKPTTRQQNSTTLCCSTWVTDTKTKNQRQKLRFVLNWKHQWLNHRFEYLFLFFSQNNHKHIKTQCDRRLSFRLQKRISENTRHNLVDSFERLKRYSTKLKT